MGLNAGDGMEAVSGVFLFFTVKKK